MHAICALNTLEFLVLQTEDRLLHHGTGSQPPVSFLQPLGATLRPSAGASAVQLCRRRPLSPQTVSLQSSPTWTGGAVLGLPLNNTVKRLKK